MYIFSLESSESTHGWSAIAVSKIVDNFAQSIVNLLLAGQWTDGRRIFPFISNCMAFAAPWLACFTVLCMWKSTSCVLFFFLYIFTSIKLHIHILVCIFGRANFAHCCANVYWNVFGGSRITLVVVGAHINILCERLELWFSLLLSTCVRLVSKRSRWIWSYSLNDMCVF